MHLDHKIPWNTASTHFNLIRCNRRFTPHRTNLFSRNKPSESTDLSHFRRVFIATIREFSHTKPLSPISLDKLISDSLLSYPERKYGLGPHETNSALHNPLSAKHQNIQYWINRAGTPEEPAYSSNDGDLSDAVKMLVIIAASANGIDTEAKERSREAISALLTLSRHSQIPIHTLNNIHWGHGFGVALVADFALEAYLLINLVDGVLSRNRLTSGNSMEKEVSLLEMESFRYLISKALPDYDYPVQNIPHRAFWNELGVTDTWAYQQKFRQCVGGEEQDMNAIDPLGDGNEEVRQGLRQYLKTCFAILYVYDMLLREWYGEDEANSTWKYWIDCYFGSCGCKLE
ncbi:uncharacterized protein ASPGLDRAFT_120308 [Aspergillus glaucus CBS 516.65]|uniref:Uncharacterized protein n=1 Tax=Aspergillus glaucus CBS 516.65 TaxID=1160497 RepID=A0A1L9VU79_ASPGL|nr:hypothetical protein ASPGLDRAFT_120308 [Aspergillus glaucus CBS 516.65]OJJ87459.1 hypothetical protein ASPGLDRAFT_120308 [Aspergillus glaucus CBS 516.65]